MSETFALSNAFEHGLRTRDTVVYMRGQLNIRQLEAVSAALGHVWLTHCESIFARLVSHHALICLLSDQFIKGDREGCDLEVDASNGDYLRWIDASADAVRLLDEDDGFLPIETLNTGIFDLRPTEESLAIQSQRQKVEC